MIDLSEQTRAIYQVPDRLSWCTLTVISSRILKTTLGYNYDKKVIRRK